MSHHSWIVLLLSQALGCASAAAPTDAATPEPEHGTTAEPPVAPPSFSAPPLPAALQKALAERVVAELGTEDGLRRSYPTSEGAATLCPTADRTAFLAALEARAAAGQRALSACRMGRRTASVLEVGLAPETSHLCPGDASFRSIEVLVEEGAAHFRMRLGDPVVLEDEVYLLGDVTCEEVPRPDTPLPKVEWHGWAVRADTGERVDILKPLRRHGKPFVPLKGLIEIEIIVPDGLPLHGIELEVNAKAQNYRRRVKRWTSRELDKATTLRWKVAPGALMYFELTCHYFACPGLKAFPVWVEPATRSRR